MDSWMADALAVLERGMELEREGNRFYAEAAERTNDARGRAMFAALADDELAHLRVLEEQHRSLRESGAWKAPAVAYRPRDRSLEALSLFPRDPADVQKAIGANASELEALQFGIHIEHKSYDFYDGLARAARDEGERALFQRLAAEEEGHRKLLQATFDYLSDPAAWFQLQEKPIFEG